MRGANGGGDGNHISCGQIMLGVQFILLVLSDKSDVNRRDSLKIGCASCKSVDVIILYSYIHNTILLQS